MKNVIEKDLTKICEAIPVSSEGQIKDQAHNILLKMTGEDCEFESVISPTGTIRLTENGIHNVAEWEFAQVDVSPYSVGINPGTYYNLNLTVSQSSILTSTVPNRFKGVLLAGTLAFTVSNWIKVDNGVVSIADASQMARVLRAYVCDPLKTNTYIDIGSYSLDSNTLTYNSVTAYGYYDESTKIGTGWMSGIHFRDPDDESEAFYLACGPVPQNELAGSFSSYSDDVSFTRSWDTVQASSGDFDLQAGNSTRCTISTEPISVKYSPIWIAFMVSNTTSDCSFGIYGGNKTVDVNSITFYTPNVEKRKR